MTTRSLPSVAFLHAFCVFTGLQGEEAGRGLFVGSQPIDAIVVEPRASQSEMEAADALGEYVEKMTGVKLRRPDASDSRLDRRGAIFLAQAAVGAGGFTPEEAAEAGYEGYRIRTRDGNVHLAGGKYYGTYYGAYHFLEQLGARFYSHDHEVVPECQRITMPALDILRRPVFEFRQIKYGVMRLGQHRGDRHTMRPNEIDPGLTTWVHWAHCSQYLVPFYKYGESHPEYYAQRADGSYDAVRMKNSIGKLHICMSNPKVREIAKARLIEAFEKQPDRRLFSVTQSDGYGWCECEGCRALDTRPGVRTDRLLDFVNEIARAVRTKYPDKIIMTDAYCRDTAPVPVRAKPEPNVRVVLCPYTPEVQDKAHWFDHRLNRKFMPWYEGWVKLLLPGQLFIFEYPYADFRSLTFFHEHHFDRIKRYAQDGVRGIYYDGRDRFMFSLFEYVTSRLAWEPGLDTRPIIEDFIASYYGPASPVMLRMYDFMAGIAARDDRNQGPFLDMRKFVTSEECAALFGLFTEAEELTKDSPTHLERVKEDKVYLLHTDLSKHNPVLGTCSDLSQFKTRLGEYVTLLLTTPTRSLFRHGIRKNSNGARSWFWRVARLRITADKIADDPILHKLMADPQSVHIPKAGLKPRLELLADAKGWCIPLGLSEGAKHRDGYGYECPRRENVYVLRTRRTDHSLMRLGFNLHEAPGSATLAIDGQDDEKPGATRVRIALNDRELFRGPNRFRERGWSTCRYPLPTGLLVEGKNELVIEDLEEGDDVFAQWVIVADVRIETRQAVSAPPPRTLLLAHFDGSADADVSANREAKINGKIRLSPDGKWDGALDIGYQEPVEGTLYFEGADNISPHAGTAEMWVKPGWTANEDKIYRTFLYTRHVHHLHKDGLLLFRYSGHPLQLNYLAYYDGGPTLAGNISHWQAHEWHHVAITWDAKAHTRQFFLDGVLVGLNQKAKVGAEMPDFIYVGAIHSRPEKARPAGALIDELRLTDRVLWQGNKVGGKVFDPPAQPYRVAN